jgi:hypothetical protein
MRTRACLRVLMGHTNEITGVVALRRDRALSVSLALRLWDLTTRHILRVFEGHSDSVTDIVSLQGRRRAFRV